MVLSKRVTSWNTIEYKESSASGSALEISIPPTVICPLSRSQNRAASRDTVVLPPPEGPTRGSDLPLPGGEGNVPQNRLTGVIGKAHMVKCNIVSFVGQAVIPLLDGVVKNFIHPGNVGTGGDHRRQILQGALKRVIQPGHHQQEQEEGEHIQCPLHQQDGACQGHGGNAQFQDEGGADHKSRQAKLIDDTPALHARIFCSNPNRYPFSALFAFRSCKVSMHSWMPSAQAILASMAFLAQFLLHPSRAAHDSKGNRQHPQGGQGQTPVKSQQAEGDQQGRDNRSGQLRDKVRKTLFQEGAVCHNGAGQVGQVFLPEKRQGNLPELFGQV